MSVLVIALVGQISVAVVHLERARPHIAAMVIFTSGIVIVLGLIASHQFPFSSAVSVSPEPIAEVLKRLRPRFCKIRAAAAESSIRAKATVDPAGRTQGIT